MPDIDNYKNPYDLFEETIAARNDGELNELYSQYLTERARLGEIAEYELAVHRSLSRPKMIEQRDLVTAIYKEICERLNN